MKMKRYFLAPLAAFCLNWSGAAISADFVAVRIEAENFTSKSDRWALTTPDFTPDLGPDPDPPHNDSASGKANLELLPDTRVTHNDEVFNGGPDGNFWGAPGGGPRIDYNVNIPEAGRYFVYVKTFSTNTEDNGIHVGVNGTLPASGQRIQICSKHNWFWTSGQRTDENHCGVTKTIWLDFPAAGVNTVTFFAREDGFEIDQFLLLKETHDGSLDCFPTFNDKIRCNDIATGTNTGDTEIPFSQTVDGNTVTTPPQPEPEPVLVDLDLDLNAIGSAHFIEDTIEYLVRVSNNSSQDTANNTAVKIDLPAGLVFNASADCTAAAAAVNCAFGDLAPGSSNTLSFTATAVAEGNHRADAQVTADEDDNNNSNNTDSATISAQQSIPDFEAGVIISQGSNASSIGGINQYTATITNNGQQLINTATLRVTTEDGLSAQQCNPGCAVPVIAPGESEDVTFNIVASQSGIFNVTAELVLIDDANSANNTATLSESVVDSNGVAVSDNNNVITFEAESFDSASIAATANAPQWFLIDDNFKELPQQLDPDNATHQNLSSGAYVEILPDLRIDDNASSIAGVSNISDGGIGSTLSYQFFAEAGTYNVYARIRSNNTQDSSLHVGLNNNWPASSKALAVCNPDGNWQWTNNILNGSSCNTASKATLIVETSGLHTLMVSQDTDGLELDKLILSQDDISDLSGNGPLSITVDSTQETDISINSVLSDAQVAAGDTTEFTVTVGNESSVEANGVTVSIDGVRNFQSGGFDSCTSAGFTSVCTIRGILPGQQINATFLVDTNEMETNLIQSTVSVIQSDANITNNESQVTLTIAEDESQGDQGNKVAGSSGGGSLSVWFLLSALLILLLNATLTTRTVEIRKPNKADF